MNRSVLMALGLAVLAASCDPGTDEDTQELGESSQISNSRCHGLDKNRRREIVENRTSLGNGYVESYAEVNGCGEPLAIGVAITQAAIDSLPTERNDGALCWDLDGDGLMNHDTECGWGHNRVLYLPKLPDVPFTYILFNWATFGHGPLHVFDKPHFDIHIYDNDNLERLAIRPGPCTSFINCDDLATATKLLPPEFFPDGFEYQVGGAAQGMMGMHIVDTDAPEHHGGELTQTFAYGAYNGHLTFWEPLVTLSFLQTRPNTCADIAQPAAVEKTGFYPLQYCTRYRPHRNDYVITLEDFEFREGADPAAK